MNLVRIKINSILIICTAIIILLSGLFSSYAETLPYENDYPAATVVETLSSEDNSMPFAPTEPASETLPYADKNDVVVPKPFGVADKKDEPKLFWGFVMWIVVGVLIAVILAVVLTNKTKAYRGGGKKRYSTGNKMGGKKRLLNEKYYNNRKRK